MNKTVSKASLKGLVILVMVLALVFAMPLAVSADTEQEGESVEPIPAEIDQLSEPESLQPAETNLVEPMDTQCKKMSIKVTKNWVGEPADSVTFKLWKERWGDDELIATKTLTEAPWEFNFSNLPKSNDYYVTEDTIPGYDSSRSGNAKHGYTFTNTDQREYVSVDKTWVGEPATNVTYVLQKDKIGDWHYNWIDVEEVTVQDPWTYTFSYYPEDNYRYQVVERSIPGYDDSRSGNICDGYTFTNTDLRKSVSVNKIWVGEPTTDVTYVLQKDRWGGGANWIDVEEVTVQDPWTYTFTYIPEDRTSYRVTERPITDYATSVDGNICNGYTFTNTLLFIDIPVNKAWVGDAASNVTVNLLSDAATDGVMAATGYSVVLNAGNSWSGSFDHMPVYTEGGRTIDYGLEEVSITGYTSEISGDEDGFTVTNTRDTIQIPVTKSWVGEATSNVMIYLLSDEAEDGTMVATGDILTLNTGNGWTDTFTNLPEYTTDGRAIDYDIAEVSLTGYTTEKVGDQSSGFTVTNTRDLIDIDVEKAWEGDPASSVTINLLADGVQVDTVTLNDPWTHTFTDLPEYTTDGVLINYSIEEVTLTGYTTEIEGDSESGFTVTNERDLIDIDVEKAWEGEPASSVTIDLLADGVQVDTVTLNDPWTHTFTDLPEYTTDGVLINYSIEEVTLTGYTSEIEGDSENGFVVTNERDTIDIPVTKEWAGETAESITINLLSDEANDGDMVATGDSLVLSEANGWAGLFSDLPEYTTDGRAIDYNVEEVPVESYISSIIGNQSDGFIVLNSQVLSFTELRGTKVWLNDNEDVRPDSVIIDLYADGVLYDSQTITGTTDTWEWVFEELPIFRISGGEELIEIVYTVGEREVENYTTTVDGYTIYNDYDETDVSPATGQGSSTGLLLILTAIAAVAAVTMARLFKLSKE